MENQKLDLSALKIVQENYEFHQRQKRAMEYSEKCAQRKEIEMFPTSATAGICVILIMFLIAISGSMIF